MVHLKCLNELSEEAIGAICEMIDLLSLVAVLKIGNRLLTAKICSQSGIGRYQDVGEYGISELAHHWLLPQLKGIKSVSLNLPSSNLLSRQIFGTIPDTATSIDLNGRQWVEVCLRKDEEDETTFQPSLVPLDLASRFPHLISLSLHNPTADDFDLLEQYPERKEWRNEFWSVFPPGLTRLCFNMTLWSSTLNEIVFPGQLQYLELVVNQFKFGWIFSLPHLHTLIMRSMEWMKLDEDDEWEDEVVFERKHRMLRRLHLLYHPVVEVFDNFEPKTLKALLSCLPALEELAVDFDENSDMPHDSFTMASSSLRSFTCGHSRFAKYPNSLTKLDRERVREPDIGFLEANDSEISLLPPSLLELYDPLLFLEDHHYSLLPRSLTTLVVHSIELDFLPDCPPLLTRLGSIVYDFSSQNLLLSNHVDKETLPQNQAAKVESDSLSLLLSKLNSLPHLSIAEVNGTTLYRTKDVNHSIFQSGWTCLFYAALKEDLDALQTITVEKMAPSQKSQQEKLQSLWTQLLDIPLFLSPSTPYQLPTATLDWFRMRGLCANPRSLGAVSFLFLYSKILQTPLIDSLAFFKWASPFLQKSDWPKLLRCIPATLWKHSIVEYMTSQGFKSK